MYRNSLTLPLIALVLALASAGMLAFDLNLKRQAEQASALTVDGAIIENEYENSLQIDGLQMDVYWSMKKDRISIGLRAPSKGWIAIAINPEGPFMKGGDIIIGYVKDQQLFLQDSYAQTPTGHQPDVELGGRDDIIERAGSESDSGTIIEFSRNLETGDPYDKPIREGQPMIIQVAYADEDDFSSYHGRSRALVPQVNFFQTGSTVGVAKPLWPGLPSHLEAYELGLVAWVIVVGLFAIQGFLSIWIEGRELKVGESARASESAVALLLAAFLTVLTLVLAWQFMLSLYRGAPPSVIAVYAALSLFTLAAFILIYRRAFVPSETIVQAHDDHVPW